MRKFLFWSMSAVMGMVPTMMLPRAAFAENDRSKVHLVAIGVSDYLHDYAERHGDIALQDLNFADDDATAIAEVLKSHGLAASDITLLADGPTADATPTHENVLRALDEASKKPTDMLLVMFFGHGVEVRGASHLCLADTSIKRIGTEYSIENGLSVQKLSDLLAAANATTKVIVTDACRNLHSEDTNVDFSEVSNYDIGKHLKELGKDQQVGQHLILSSCLPNQVALEPEELKHGLFANFLIKGLQGHADYDKGNRDGKISLQELFYFTAKNTSEYALEQLGRKQFPWIQMGSAEEIYIVNLSEDVQKEMADKFPSVSFNSRAFSHEQQMALQQYELALDAFAILNINSCISLLDRVTEVLPNHTESLRLRALCYTLTGQEIKAIDELKKLSRTLKAKVYASESTLLGVRNPTNVSQSLASFSQGDVLEIVNYSGEGTNSSGEVLPAGKYLYVKRLQRQDSQEWIDVEGVVFADAIKPTNIDQVVQRIQESQRQFGNTRIQSDEEIRRNTGVTARGVVANASPAQRAETALRAAETGLSLYSHIRSGNTAGIVMDGIGIVAPNAAPKVQRGYEAYRTVRGIIGL